MDDPLTTDCDRLREEQMLRAILAYLSKHPRAMDTFEGIAQWWISQEGVHADRAALAKTLARLTEQPLLEVVEVVGSAGTPCYRLKAHGGPQA